MFLETFLRMSLITEIYLFCYFLRFLLVMHMCVHFFLVEKYLSLFAVVISECYLLSQPIVGHNFVCYNLRVL